jgi:purine-binding chemotaxis protein CheW
MSGVHVRLRVGAERYALPIDSVLEVAEFGGLSAVPGAGAAVLGVRNLRGHVLPVFDLARVLAIPGDGPTPRILIAEHEGCLAGLAVAEVSDVAELVSEDEEDSEVEHLRGTSLEHGRLVGIIDVAHLFASLAKATA